MKLPEKLQKKLEDRDGSNSLRTLSIDKKRIDLYSNDYLGFATERNIFDKAHKLLDTKGIYKNGATGSRLLSGNYDLYVEVEKELAKFHNAEAALLFNSGYDANVGFFSSVPQRGDIILYDELIHASIRDGIKMSTATSYKFKHNDWSDLQKKLQFVKFDKAGKNEFLEIYIVTESVFSMDGDVADLQSLVAICRDHNCNLVIDEAHATGVYGEQGEGLLQELGLEDMIFARIHTFGKAMGCHGAVIFGNEELKKYLINFARSFIYTTGLPPHSLATILVAYQELQITSQIKKLKENITFFNQKLESINLKTKFIQSNSAIHCCIIPSNENVKKVAFHIQKKGFDIKPILSPTVAKGKERLRFCLHSYNSKEEISEVLELLTTFV
ncbi:aminotransferase class I/II-fold pyridoxal phosphate-dependent enzyme [Aquimarina muelleri]|uniref:8-amino-7-oxononanoate synthase n=1 Tax=Aquimarina muelleri TaxID=279356 RepID=A0A918JTL1_9FLAO|nr:pyridoxal phosphate-dependent aminotransferase family protein [Aquimarina muelleri]MCX2761578.1 pyridoxal phosphate-dependent aminotransferase family protein [Aquimarina muelleri]GGX07770.1 8-amino-7-oxononanoate synthase [Aquimarina muelleri]